MAQTWKDPAGYGAGVCAVHAAFGAFFAHKAVAEIHCYRGRVVFLERADYDMIADAWAQFHGSAERFLETGTETVRGFVLPVLIHHVSPPEILYAVASKISHIPDDPGRKIGNDR